MTDAQNRAIVALYRQYAATMVHLTYRRLYNLELAKDLVQEAFLIACCKADDMFAKGDNPKAWLFRTLEYITMQERRKGYYVREVAVEDISDLLVNTDDLLGIQTVLPNSLNAQEKEILILRLNERLTYEEIAARCNTTPENCRKRYSRAVKHCKALLEKKYN